MKKTILFVVTLLLGTFSFSQSNKDFLIVSCFSQGSANNCASIALIKAAMLRYGYKNMFTVFKNQNNYSITLKDGTQFTISEMELVEAKKAANYKIPDLPMLGNEKDSVLLYAYLAYASIAKFIAAKGYWGCEEAGSPYLTDHSNYNDALKFITRTSYCTDYCNRLLGYKVKEGKIYNFEKASDIRLPGTILYSPAHAVATFSDHLDCHGSWVPLTGNEVCNNKFKWFIVLE